jgi:small subunit ribosomal protein S1
MELETFADQSSTDFDSLDRDSAPTITSTPNAMAASPVSSQPDRPPTGFDEYLANGYDYQAPIRGDIRTGTVIGQTDYGLLIDIGFKREGIVPLEDLTRLDDETRSQIDVGAEVSVFVLRPENREGHPVLSIHQARMYEDWLKADKMMESGTVYEGVISGCNRGGLIVKFGKIRGFVPASQIVGLPRRLREEQRRQRMEAMVGETIGLKVIEVDRQRRRLILSQRRAMRAWQEIQRQRVISELVEGTIRRGKVTSITDFGAFVDLGGADGLIHVSEMSWGRVGNPRDVLKVGDEIDVYVLDVDQAQRRIALSLKKLRPDPWTTVDERYRQGQLVEGTVTRVLDFGAFVEVEDGLEGLLHASEMIGTPELNPSDIVHPGESLPIKIIRIESHRRRLALSARQVSREEWERWGARRQTAAETAPAEQPAPAETEAEALADETVAAADDMPVEAAAYGDADAESELETALLVDADDTDVEEDVEVDVDTADETDVAAEEL